MIHVISKYLLASAVVGGCSVVFVLRAIRTTKNRRDGDRIYQFLRRSVKDGQYGFRSSEAISTVTNLPISRVVDLCSKHGHIERKEHERHMWRIDYSVYGSSCAFRNAAPDILGCLRSATTQRQRRQHWHDAIESVGAGPKPA
jgi:hypothetical protein